MPVNSYTVGGPVGGAGGVLTFGSVGTSLDQSTQVKSCKVTPSVKKEDATRVLSGDTLAGDRTVTWTLAAKLVQDLTDDGNIEWTWDHSGEDVPFTYTPSSAAGKSISGIVTIDPIEVGGDVGAKPDSDIEWTVVGDPTIAADLT